VKRIIIADDMGLVRKATIRILRNLKLELEIQEADDGRAALALAKRNPPDLIITDGEMREMHGPELISELRKDPVLSDVRIIMYSGSPSLEKTASLLGVPFFAKASGRPADLVVLVRETLGIV
jgi:CheY-like chemotaxis protein